MNWKIAASTLLILFLSSCATQNPSKDIVADEALGVAGEDPDAAAAQQALEDVQKTHQKEHQQQLERQITDPVVANNR